MFSIRPAAVEDNQALLDLEKMCPQGTSLILQFDRSPDFFRRSQVYHNSKVYVAEEEGKTVGTIAFAVKEFNFDGKRTRGAYVYDLRVHPDNRGKGLGSELVEHVLDQKTDAQIAYAVIAQDNYPSLTLFKKMGFQRIHDIVLFNVPLYEMQRTAEDEVRTMTTDDVTDVVTLLNDYYHERDFFSTLDETAFLDRVKRLPGYGLEKIQVAVDNDRVVACAGLWDYSEIFRITALHVSTRLKALSYLLKFVNIFKKTMQLPSTGESFRVMYVTDFAYDGQTEPAEKLVKQCLRLAHSRGCSFLSFPFDPCDPAVPLLTRHKPIKTSYSICAKNLINEAQTCSATIYVDSADL